MNAARRHCLRTAAALPAWLVGCRDAAPLTIAYHPWPGYAPLKLAESLGWWDDGRVRTLATASASASREALEQGRAQAAALTLDEALLASADGVPLRVVGMFNVSHGADVVLARPSHAEPARWRGARIGHEQGAVGELMLVNWLAQAGLEAGQVQAVHLTVDEHEAAWHAGRIDILVTYEPVASRLRALGAVPVYDSTQLPKDSPIVDVLTVHADALRRQAPALRQLMRTIFAAQRHLFNLTLDSSYRLAPWLGLPPQRALTTLAGLHLTTWADNREWLIGDPPRLQRVARALAAFLHQQGLRPHAGVPDDWVSGQALPAEEPA